MEDSIKHPSFRVSHRPRWIYGSIFLAEIFSTQNHVSLHVSLEKNTLSWKYLYALRNCIVKNFSFNPALLSPYPLQKKFLIIVLSYYKMNWNDIEQVWRFDQFYSILILKIFQNITVEPYFVWNYTQKWKKMPTIFLTYEYHLKMNFWNINEISFYNRNVS